MRMRNLLLTISYKGTNYHGFQVQKNAVTVCEVLQDAMETLLGASGRTSRAAPAPTPEFTPTNIA
jgi:tRNA pseudouridine(38-40) synthase